MTAVERLNKWAKEVTSESALEIAKCIDQISEALDAREDLRMPMTHREYGVLTRQIEQMQRTTMMLSEPWLRDTYKELFTPLMIRLPKHQPSARPS